MRSKSAIKSAALLAAALCVVLSGCSEKTDTTSDDSTKTTTVTESTATASESTDTTANSSSDTDAAESTTADKAAFDEYVAYNSLEKSKADGVNLQLDFYTYEDDKLSLVCSNLCVPGKMFTEFDNGTTIYCSDELSFYRFEEDGETVFNPILFGADGLDTFITFDPFFALEAETLLWTTSDKQFIAETEVTDKEYVEDCLSGYSLEYEEGMGIHNKYTFDKETKKLLELEVTALYPDGSEQIDSIVKFSYNVDFPDPLASEEYKEFADAANDTAQCRTVRVTYAPNTDKEQTIEYNIPKGHNFYIFTDNFVTEIYTDPECSQAFVSGDTSGDLELFVPLD